MADFDGTTDSLIHIALDAYTLRDVPFLTVAPVVREILPYRFERLMSNQAGHVFTCNDHSPKGC